MLCFPSRESLSRSDDGRKARCECELRRTWDLGGKEYPKKVTIPRHIRFPAETSRNPTDHCPIQTKPSRAASGGKIAPRPLDPVPPTQTAPEHSQGAVAPCNHSGVEWLQWVALDGLSLSSLLGSVASRVGEGGTNSSGHWRRLFPWRND